MDINLLPWRRLSRQQQQKKIQVVLSMVVICVILAMFLVLSSLRSQRLSVMREQAKMQQKISERNLNIYEMRKMVQQQQVLLAKIKQLQSIDEQQKLLFRFLDKLPTVLPLKTYLLRLTQSDRQVVLAGYAPSNRDISRLMWQLEQLPWLHGLKLTKVTHDSHGTFHSNNDLVGHNGLRYTIKLVLGVLEQQK